jgi:hypothetical protein
VNSPSSIGTVPASRAVPPFETENASSSRLRRPFAPGGWIRVQLHRRFRESHPELFAFSGMEQLTVCADCVLPVRPCCPHLLRWTGGRGRSGHPPTSWRTCSRRLREVEAGGVRAQAVLRSAGVLKLAPPLAAKIDAGEALRAGGEEEVALRAATVVGAAPSRCRRRCAQLSCSDSARTKARTHSQTCVTRRSESAGAPLRGVRWCAWRSRGGDGGGRGR